MEEEEERVDWVPEVLEYIHQQGLLGSGTFVDDFNAYDFNAYFRAAAPPLDAPNDDLDDLEDLDREWEKQFGAWEEHKWDKWTITEAQLKMIKEYRKLLGRPIKSDMEKPLLVDDTWRPPLRLDDEFLLPRKTRLKDPTINKRAATSSHFGRMFKTLKVEVEGEPDDDEDMVRMQEMPSIEEALDLRLSASSTDLAFLRSLLALMREQKKAGKRQDEGVGDSTEHDKAYPLLQLSLSRSLSPPLFSRRSTHETSSESSSSPAQLYFLAKTLTGPLDERFSSPSGLGGEIDMDHWNNLSTFKLSLRRALRHLSIAQIGSRLPYPFGLRRQLLRRLDCMTAFYDSDEEVDELDSDSEFDASILSQPLGNIATFIDSSPRPPEITSIQPVFAEFYRSLRVPVPDLPPSSPPSFDHDFRLTKSGGLKAVTLELNWAPWAAWDATKERQTLQRWIAGENIWEDGQGVSEAEGWEQWKGELSGIGEDDVVESVLDEREERILNSLRCDTEEEEGLVSRVGRVTVRSPESEEDERKLKLRGDNLKLPSELEAFGGELVGNSQGSPIQMLDGEEDDRMVGDEDDLEPSTFSRRLLQLEVDDALHESHQIASTNLRNVLSPSTSDAFIYPDFSSSPDQLGATDEDNFILDAKFSRESSPTFATFPAPTGQHSWRALDEKVDTSLQVYEDPPTSQPSLSTATLQNSSLVPSRRPYSDVELGETAETPNVTLPSSRWAPTDALSLALAVRAHPSLTRLGTLPPASTSSIVKRAIEKPPPKATPEPADTTTCPIPLPSFLSTDPNAPKPRLPLRVIVDLSVLQHPDLLQALHRENFILVDRPPRHPPHPFITSEPSLILDGKSCVLFKPLAKLVGNATRSDELDPKYEFKREEAIMTSVLRIVQSFDRILVVLEAAGSDAITKSGKKLSPFTPPVCAALLSLSEAIKEMMGDRPDVKVEVVVSKSAEDSASIARSLTRELQQADEASKCLDNFWDERVWLPNDPTEEELDYSSIPELNHFSAAALGAFCAVSDFLNMTPEARSKSFGHLCGFARLDMVSQRIASNQAANPAHEQQYHSGGFSNNTPPSSPPKFRNWGDLTTEESEWAELLGFDSG